MKKLTPYLFILPAMVLFITFTLLPVLSGFRLALFNAGPRHREFVGLSNFTFLLKSEVFIKGLLNTVLYTIICVPPLVLFPLALAIGANNMSEKNQVLYRTLFCIPMLVAPSVIAAIFRWMFETNYGLINVVFRTKISWLGSMPYALYAVCFTHVLMGLGIPFLIYMASLKTVSVEHIESAVIDGANKFQINTRIIIPIISPIITFITLMTTLGVLQIFGTIYMLTWGGPAFGTTSLIYIAYNYAFIDGRYGLASAVAVVLLVIMLAFTIPQFVMRRKLS